MITYVCAYICTCMIMWLLKSAPPMTAPTVTVTPLSSTSFNVSWTITDPDHNYMITWTGFDNTQKTTLLMIKYYFNHRRQHNSSIKYTVLQSCQLYSTRASTIQFIVLV